MNEIVEIAFEFLFRIDCAAVQLGLSFWCAFAAAAYLSWPWLASL